MDYGLYALLLLAVGLAVLVVEVFVPSGGLLAVITLLCLAGSVLCAAWEWWGTNMLAFWVYVGTVAALIPGTLGGALFMLPRTAFGRRLLQEAPTPEETASFTRERAELAATVGRRGVTLTPHNPGGMVEVDGRRLHAEARGLMLDAGEPVEVVGVRGNRLLVRLADAPVPASPELGGPDRHTSPVPPVIEGEADRPGGHIAPDAPVGYARQSEPPELAPDRDGPETAPEPREPDDADAIPDPFAADAERDSLPRAAGPNRPA